MRVYCFGNEFVKEDSLAKKIISNININGIEFKKCNSVEDIDEKDFKRLFIIDVVENINEVIAINDIDRLKDRNIISLHDFDLQFFLKLLRSMDKIKKITIIGLPQKGNLSKIREKIRNMLEIK